MADTILFLVRSGVLVLFDHIVDIIINACTGHDSGLGPSLHGQLVDIVTSLFVPDKIAFFHPVGKHFPGLFIHTCIVGIHLVPKLGFGAVNCQKGLWIFPNDFLCLRTIIHIIRQRCDGLCHSLCRSHTYKWFYLCHNFSLD